MEWPEWWQWELELSPHVEARMEDRDFTEVDLREMLEIAQSHEEDVLEGRWIIKAKHGGERWEVVVEPDMLKKMIIVITAYKVSG